MTNTVQNEWYVLNSSERSWLTGSNINNPLPLISADVLKGNSSELHVLFSGGEGGGGEYSHIQAIQVRAVG